MSRAALFSLVIAAGLLAGCGAKPIAPGAGPVDDDGGIEGDPDGGPTPECVRNADCGADQRCETSSGTCVTAANGEIGDSCLRNSACTQGSEPQCLLSTGGFPSGYCVSECVLSECEGASTCVSGLNGTTEESVCVALCSSSADCRGQYQCVPVGSAGVCMPPCVDTSVCGTGQTCDRASGQCRTACTTNGQCPLAQLCNTTTRRCEESAPDAGPPPVGNPGVVTSTSLGNLNANGQVSISAPVPSDAVSSFFIATTNGPQFKPMVQLSFLREPSGVVVYGGTRDVMTVAPNGDMTAGVLYPNAPPPRTTNNTNNLPGLTYTPGNFSVGFISQPVTQVAVTLLTKTATGELTSGTIDVNLWFDSARYTAATAKTSSTFQTALRSIQTIWGAVGIRMGTVTYLDLPDANHAYRNIQGEDVQVLSAMTGGAPNDGVNWIFVDSIDGSGSGGNTTLGVAAGIPGTPLKGSGQSGVVVSLLTLQGSGAATRLATTIAHETGHWLGLFHTSEATGTDFDPIPDTAQCPAASYDRDHDGSVDDRECSTLDGTNLMFWLSDSTGQSPHTTITADQQFVLLRNPALH